jgi:hypothetical protein
MAVEEPEQEYTADDIQRALGHLAFNQRAALVMRELEGRSYAEIAEIMGLTVGAVETLIFRGRRALREQLEGTLSCDEAELALSKQADGMLARGERGQLRAHLRECKECAALARRQRATRTALKALGAIPLPSSLLGMFGGGSAVGLGLAAKAAMVVAAGVVVGGGGYEASRHVDLGHPKQAAVAKLPIKAAPAKRVATLPKRSPAVHVSPRKPVKALQPAHGSAKAKHSVPGPKPKPSPKQGPGLVAAAGHLPTRAHGEPTNPVKRPAHEPMNPVKKRPVQPNHKPTVVHEPKPRHEPPAHPVAPAATPKPEKKEKRKPTPPTPPMLPAVTVPANTDTPGTPTPTTTAPTLPNGNPGLRGPKK